MDYTKTIHPRQLLLNHRRRSVTKANLIRMIARVMVRLPTDNLGRRYLHHHLQSLISLPNDVMYNDTWNVVNEYAKRMAKVIVELDTPIEPPNQEVENQDETLFELFMIFMGIVLWYGITMYSQNTNV